VAEKDHFPDFEDFARLIGKLEPGRTKTPLIVRYRKGGSASAWGEPGSNFWVPFNGYFQVGSVQWTGAAASSGALSSVLRNPFSDTPIVIVTPYQTVPLFTAIYCQAICDSYNLEIYWWSAANITAATFHFICFGPGAL